MKSFLDEARELIEMSLKNDIDKKEYSQKASRWLEKATAHQAHKDTSGETITCDVCGYDLVCPNCSTE